MQDGNEDRVPPSRREYRLRCAAYVAQVERALVDEIRAEASRGLAAAEAAGE